MGRLVRVAVGSVAIGSALSFAGCSTGPSGNAGTEGTGFEGNIGKSSERQVLAPLAFTEWEPATHWGGRTVAIDIDPTNSQIAFTAAESGGVFKTTNGGTSWSHLAKLPPFRMVDVGISPRNTSIVLATAVNDTKTVNGGGIWRSTDGGATWQKPATATPPGCARASAWAIAFAPDSNSVFVGTDCGIAVSRDSGATWTHISPDTTRANSPVYSLVAQAGGIVDVLGSNGHYRSSGNGAAGTWSATNFQPGSNPTGGGGIAAQAIAVSPFEPNVIFAVTPASGGYQVWESDDGGTNWSGLNPPANGTNRPPYIHVHASSNGTQDLDVFFGDGVLTQAQTCVGRPTSGLPRCAQAWGAVGQDHTDPSDMAYATGNNCPIYQSGDFGLQTTTDCGQNWTTTGNGFVGLNALQMYEATVQVHPDHLDVYYGTQDNQLWGSGDGGVSWPNVIGNEGWFLEVPHATPSDVGQVVAGAVPGAVFLATAHFASSGSWNNAPSSTSNPWVVDVGTYVQFGSATGGGNQLYLSTDTGTTWNPVANGVIPEGLPERARVAGPTANPTLFQPISGTTGTVIRRMRNILGSATVSNPGIGLGSIDQFCDGQGTFRCPFAWGVAPSDPNRLIAADSSTGQMKVSTNAGDNWNPDNQLTALVKNNGEFLFPSQAHAVGFDPTNAQRALVGTEAAGVIATFDGGTSWLRVPGTTAIPAITSFSFDEVRGEVLIATYGRGLFKMGWCPATPGADTTAPTFTFVPPDLTTQSCGTLNIGTARATDVCSATAVTITNNAPAKFPPGTTLVTWRATDAAGNTTTATQRVTVILGDDPACCPAGTNIIIGTSNNDTLNGTSGSDCILGKGAQDTINGNGGNDFISGGDGDDIINGGPGNDVVFGGSGQDQLTGDIGDDQIFGDDGDDTLHGNAGNDTLHGGQGQDNLFGDDNNDNLFGDTGNDTLNGGNGDDNLVGNDGNADVCTDTSGSNTFATCETAPSNSCTDGTKDGTESDVDCGGGCGTRCDDGKTCTSGNDCSSFLCVAGICAPSSGIATSTSGLLQASLQITTDFGSGYCAAIRVINNAPFTALTWNLGINIPGATTYTTWNGSFSGNTGAVTITPTTNPTIPAFGVDTSIGFCANRTVSGSLPSITSASGTFF